MHSLREECKQNKEVVSNSKDCKQLAKTVKIINYPLKQFKNGKRLTYKKIQHRLKDFEILTSGSIPQRKNKNIIF